MRVDRHTVNGKFFGAFYALSDGRQIYVAQRTPSKMHNGSWLIDESVIRRCNDRGCSYIGVVMRKGSKHLFWATLVSDFYNSYSYQKGVARGLPARQFRYFPELDPEVIKRISTIAR